MALALDGSGHSTQTSASPTVTLTTSSANDVIALFITSNDSVLSVSGGGLTWNLRSSINSGGNFLTYYYAIAASPLSSAVITVSMNSSTFSTIDAFGISGANTGSPFDGAVVTATAPAVAAITTTNANDIIIGGLLTNQTPGAGYTLVPASVPADFQMAEYQIVSATQTALNVDTAGAAASLTIADAIKQASAGGASPFIPQPMDNPQRQQRSIAFYRHVDYMVLNMQDTFFGPPGMGEPNNDWPNPRGAPRSVRLLNFWQAPPLALTVTPALPPICSTDRPNPRGAVFPQGLRGFLNPINLNLIGKDTFFGAAGQPPSPVIWANPRAAARPSFGALHIPVQGGALTLPAPAAAPASTGASIPIRRRRKR